MDPRFLEYGTSVCRYVRHATAKEKAAIQKELADHMEDHALALMNAGYDEEHSVRVALESMGEAEAVGRELDKEYPLRWLVLSRVLMVVVTLLGLYCLMFFWWYPGQVADNLHARFDPVSGHQYSDISPSFQPIDIRWELQGGTILYFYGAALQGAGEEYTVTLYAATYPKNPFSQSWQSLALNSLGFFYSSDEVPSQIFKAGGEGGGNYYRYAIHDLPKGCSLTVCYQGFGTSFQTEIPLNWEEVSP